MPVVYFHVPLSLSDALVFGSPNDASNATVLGISNSSAHLLFMNLTTVLNESSDVCTTCSGDIVILLHTTLIGTVSHQHSLVNATALYSTESATVSTLHTSLFILLLINMRAYITCIYKCMYRYIRNIFV